MGIKTLIPVLVFAALVLASGLLHGLQTDRWRASPSVQEALVRLQAVPMSAGDWQGMDTPLGEDSDVESLKRAGIQGWVSRRYRNVKTEDEVSLLIVCGKPGPISVHTPDICFAGAGFDALGEQKLKEVKTDAGRVVSVWSLAFRKSQTLTPSQIEVNWAWNAGDGWKAPERPRWTFAGSGALYKVYVVRDLQVRQNRPSSDAAVAFMQKFLPVLDKALAPKNSP